MEILRQHFLSKVFGLLTGLIFLNMSFFLAEVCMLEFQDRQMIENICNLVLNGGLEEERDAHSSGADTPLKIFSLHPGDLLLRHSSLFLIAEKIHGNSDDHYIHADHSVKFSPPPDFLSSL